MNTITESSNVERCWNIIGIGGDRSCPKLSIVTHCRNCPVYSSSGRDLLERPTPENYRLEWTEFIAQSRTKKGNQLVPNHTQPTTETLTVVIFRLLQEWLALTAQVFKETTPPSTIHTLPHRSNQILRGIVNIRGELQLCVSLKDLLNLETNNISPQSLNPVVYSRLVVVEKASNTWVFAVDELYGVHRFHRDELRDTPKNITQAAHTYSKGFFHWRSRSVSYLDDELLFNSLSRKLVL